MSGIAIHPSGPLMLSRQSHVRRAGDRRLGRIAPVAGSERHSVSRCPACGEACKLYQPRVSARRQICHESRAGGLARSRARRWRSFSSSSAGPRMNSFIACLALGWTPPSASIAARFCSAILRMPESVVGGWRLSLATCHAKAVHSASIAKRRPCKNIHSSLVMAIGSRWPERVPVPSANGKRVSGGGMP